MQLQVLRNQLFCVPGAFPAIVPQGQWWDSGSGYKTTAFSKLYLQGIVQKTTSFHGQPIPILLHEKFKPSPIVLRVRE